MDSQGLAQRSVPAPAPPSQAVWSSRADPLFLTGLAVFAIAAVWAAAPHFIDYDSVQFALALGQHDVRLHHPQPPGYVFDVWLARAVAVLTGDARRALHLVALGLTLAASGALYALTRGAFGRGTARWSAALFLTSPVVLFHALVTKIYPADACAAAVVALLVWWARRDRRLGSLLLAAAVVGLSGGFRPTAMVFALPLLGVLLIERGRREAAWGAVAAAAGAAAWFLPQLAPAGGLASYFELNRDLQAHIAAKSPWRAGGDVLVQHLHRAATVFVFGMGPARLAVLGWSVLRGRSHTPTPAPGLGRGAVAAWIAAPLLFVLSYHFPKSGYALALWPALALGLARLVRHPRALAAAMGFDVAVFFLVPTMQVCCRAPWELEEARRHPPATLVQWDWVPGAWQNVDTWSPRARRIGQHVLGKVDFYFDRSRDFDFGGVITALRVAGLPRPDAWLVGHHATRAACFELPDQPILHADVNRPQPFVLYQQRRGVPVSDTLRVPDSIRWLWLEGDPAMLAFETPAPRVVDLDVPLAHRFTLYEIGPDPLRCVYTPHSVAGSPPARMRFVRG